MDQPPLDNLTDFTVHPQRIADKDGEKLIAIVKATFVRAEDGTLELAPKKWMRGIRFADLPWGEPDKSPIMYPADVCTFKPGTDVVVVAKAHAPGAKPVPSFDAAVQVGPLRKVVRVFGLRVWQGGGGGLSAPRPLAEIEMRYDHAWGGLDDSDPQEILEEPRNPMGRGLTRDVDALRHTPAPNLEDPAHPILTADSRPPPAGMGAIGRSWEPRRRYIGTFDARWLEERAPLLPLDFDERANLCATPELIATPPLLGGEEAALLNLTPGGGTLSFLLPRVGVEIEFRVKDRAPEVTRPHLDTVLIDTVQNPLGAEIPLWVEYVWRARVPAPKRMKDARVIVREREVKRG